MKTPPFEQPQEWQFIEELKKPRVYSANWRKPSKQNDPII